MQANPEPFRSKCGDRYLDTITTGSVEANIDLRGTPFMLSEVVSFSVAEPQFEVIAEPRTWYDALRDAEARGGRLPIIHDEAENAAFAGGLLGQAQAWIGLRARTTMPREFAWPDGSSGYYNFANPDMTFLSAPGTSRGDYCAALRSSDGMWDTPYCRTARLPYLVEYRKVSGTGVAVGDDSAAGQVFDLELDAEWGCGTLSPTAPLRLVYSPGSVPVP